MHLSKKNSIELFSTLLAVALDALVGKVTLHAKQGNIESALELLTIVRKHPVAIRETRDRAEELHGILVSQLVSQQLESVQSCVGNSSLLLAHIQP